MRAMKVTACIIAALMLTSCTVVRYQSDERSLTVIDLHPGGETLSLSGVLTDLGTLDVNRNTEDSSSTVGAVVDGVVGL